MTPERQGIEGVVEGRDSAEEIARKSALIAGAPLVQTLIDAMPGIVMILNARRQVAAANRPLLETLHLTLGDVLGKRFGEVLGCSFWREGPDGCGSAGQCSFCGIFRAIRESQATRGQAVAECELVMDRPIQGTSLELHVKAGTAAIHGEPFTVCAMEDVTSRRRLAELTRIFFHDVLNMAGALQGLLGLLAERLAPGEPRDDCRRLHWLADQIVEEIESQRDLMLAEAGDLEVYPQAVRTSVLAGDLRLLYSLHESGAGRVVEASEVWDGVLITDVRLLGRVLGNMLRNALEATEKGGTVRLSCVPGPDCVVFRVHNAAVIPAALQEQLFKRSCSTKGRPGRGVGMHSMKLLGEHYLRGSVSFVSREPEGTTFSISVPKVLTASAQEGWPPHA